MDAKQIQILFNDKNVLVFGFFNKTDITNNIMDGMIMCALGNP